MTMTPERLEEIKQRLTNASPGPWEWRESEPGSLIITPEGNYHPLNILKCTDDWRPNPNDAEFIAHARQDMEDLIAEIETNQEHSRKEVDRKLQLLREDALRRY